MSGFLRRKRGRPRLPGIFTPAEERLLPLLARGLTNAEIAAQTGLSVHTVHTHVANMLAKSGAADRRALGAMRPREARGSALARLPLPAARIVAGVAISMTVVVVAVVVAVAITSQDGSGDAVTAAAPTPFPTSTATPLPTPPGGQIGLELAARALHLPALSPGDNCPVGEARTVNPAFGPALGAGPGYLVGLSARSTPNFFHGERPSAPYQDWASEKTLFTVEPPERGPILLRGRRIDGPGTVAFEQDHASADLMLTDLPPSNGNDTHGWASDVFATLVKDPGCYAIQVDAGGFSEVIVFQAVF